MVDFLKMMTGKTLDELVRPEIRALRSRGNVTWAETNIRMNSYERDHILPALTDDAFLRMMVHNAQNCSATAGPGTYDFALVHKYAPEAIRRGIGYDLEKEPPYAELGVSLPIARLEAYRRIVHLITPYLGTMPDETIGELHRLMTLAELD